MKRCNKCNSDKEEIEFFDHAWCRICCREYAKANRQRRNLTQRKRREKNPISNKESKLKHKYGISMLEYQELFDKQNGKCAICRNICSTGRSLAVDHCHKTKRIRGLLCSNCNMFLGKINDDISVFFAAINYLEPFRIF